MRGVFAFQIYKANWGGKYHGLILRIAGILHCVKCALDCVDPAEVSADIDVLSSAIKIGEYYQKQAIYAYGVSDVDPETVQAERIIEKIKSRKLTIIRQNDLYKLCRCSLFRNAAEFDETVKMLEEYGYIRREIAPAANDCNKSGFTLYINPRLHAQ